MFITVICERICYNSLCNFWKGNLLFSISNHHHLSPKSMPYLIFLLLNSIPYLVYKNDLFKRSFIYCHHSFAQNLSKLFHLRLKLKCLIIAWSGFAFWVHLLILPHSSCFSPRVTAHPCRVPEHAQFDRPCFIWDIYTGY